VIWVVPKSETVALFNGRSGVKSGTFRDELLSRCNSPLGEKASESLRLCCECLFSSLCGSNPLALTLYFFIQVSTYRFSFGSTAVAAVARANRRTGEALDRKGADYARRVYADDFRGTGDVSEAAEPNRAMSCKTTIENANKKRP
jgi:hypothetical protein